jgi:hypothetical protein
MLRRPVGARNSGDLPESARGAMLAASAIPRCDVRISDARLDEVHTRGFAVIEGFLDSATLKAAQDALWQIFPTPDAYFADPRKYESFTRSQFAGIRLFPYPSWALNRLVVLPDLVDAAERFCGTADLQLYKVELWAKYAGAVDYEQSHHRDYGNHTLVVPQRASRHVQMTTFILLSDVYAADGPTKIVPLEHSHDVPLVPHRLPIGALYDREVSITGPAGSLLIYKTDVLHRGSNFTAPDRSRFAMLVDFQPRGWAWTGKTAWPNHSLSPDWADAISRMTPRERTLFGFPAPGDPYWDAQTIRDVGARYPAMDMTPYRSADAARC